MQKKSRSAPRHPRPPGWMTREELAIRNGLSISAVDDRTIAGRLPWPYEFGSRCILFSVDEVEEHERLEKAEAKAAAVAKRASRSRVSA